MIERDGPFYSDDNGDEPDDRYLFMAFDAAGGIGGAILGEFIADVWKRRKMKKIADRVAAGLEPKRTLFQRGREEVLVWRLRRSMRKL